MQSMRNEAGTIAIRLEISRQRNRRESTMMLRFFVGMCWIGGITGIMIRYLDLYACHECLGKMFIGVMLFAIGWWHVLKEHDRQSDDRMLEWIDRGMPHE